MNKNTIKIAMEVTNNKNKHNDNYNDNDNDNDNNHKHIPENTLELLYNKYPNNKWSPISLSHNTSLTFNMIINNKNLNWDWCHLSRTVDWKYIKKYPDLNWRWDCVSLNQTISWSIIEKHLHLPWCWDSLTYHPCVTFDIIMKCNKMQKKKGYNRLNIEYISMNPNITWDIIQKHPEIKWNYMMLTKNKNISIDCIFENMHLHWSWIDVSRDERLTWKYIVKKQKSDNPWSDIEWRYISKHPNVKWEHIKSTINGPQCFGWFWNNVTENPNITFDIVNNNLHYPWNISYLINNKNITMDIIKSNPEIEWNFNQITFNTNLFNTETFNNESNLNFIIEKNRNFTILSLWFYLSQIISPDIILSHPELPWSYNSVSRNPNMTLDYIEKIKTSHDCKYDWFNFSCNTFNYQMRLNEYIIWKSRDRAARIIQRGCANWIDKPITADGKYGISVRIGMKTLF